MLVFLKIIHLLMSIPVIILGGWFFLVSSLNFLKLNFHSSRFFLPMLLLDLTGFVLIIALILFIKNLFDQSSTAKIFLKPVLPLLLVTLMLEIEFLAYKTWGKLFYTSGYNGFIHIVFLSYLGIFTIITILVNIFDNPKSNFP